jgi:adenosylcobinamide-phosphate synthase
MFDLQVWIAANAVIALLALVLEALVGYPDWLHARVPHPVVWAGNAINALERAWNKPEYSFAKRRLLGCLAVVIVVGAGVGLGATIEFGPFYVIRLLDAKMRFYSAAALSGAVVPSAGLEMTASTMDGSYLDTEPYTAPWSGYVAVGAVVLAATVGLAQRSLFVHVRDVLIALRAGDLPGARERVSRIVGRDTRQLDVSGVSAAALESLAESFNDGIVAPAFWLALGGLPGLFAYKVLNTADSLIGHKEERWRAFGWAAARADDVANLIPARIAGALLVVAGCGGLLVMLKDASKHASPNAGWPEAAMAGALSIRLGGPTSYDGVLHERPVFGTGPVAGVADLGRGLRIYVIACVLLWLLLAAVLVITLTGLPR